MRGSTARFEAVDGSSLRISLSKGKQSLKTMVRHRDAQEERTRTGCKNYFELTEEDQAQASYDELVKDAESRGWTWVTRAKAKKDAFVAIPEAPKLPMEPVSNEVAELSGKLKSALKSAKR